MAVLSWGPSDPKSGAGQYPGSSLVPGGQRGLVGAVPCWRAGQGMGNQLCPESLTLVQSLPGGSVRPTDP